MLKKSLALILSLIMIFSLFSVCASAVPSDALRFNSDGKFKIVVFADTQDDDTPHTKMIQFMGQALDREQPDLVVFTGDNVHVTTEAKFLQGATALMQPLIERDIPYAYTFGNHDAEYISKQYMHSVYMSLGRCLTYNADDSIFGYGNCNIPIYSSKNDSMAFNLWIIDSNMYPTSGGGYDNVHQDQQDWFVKTDKAIETAEGHKVNSIVFQHIVVPEVYNCLSKAGWLYNGNTKTYNGTKYKLELNSSASGSLLEWPCPPDTNSGEFTTLKNRGDVIGIVTGHDHANSFVGSYNGITFTQMPGMTFESYGNDAVRGYGVIELNENNTKTYTSRTVRYVDAYVEEPTKLNINETNNDIYRIKNGTTYISEVRCAQNESSTTAKNELTNAGFTVIDYDLNTGARGQYIYMGYKTTTNYEDAIKDLRFYSQLDDLDAGVVKFNINGKPVTYYKDGTDLNKGSGGDYVYACYSKDNLAGPAITGISFGGTIDNSRRICPVLTDKTIPADLNNGTTVHENYIYCYTTTNVESYDLGAVKAKYDQLSKIDNSAFSDPTKEAFNADLNTVKNFIDSVESSRLTSKTAAEINTMVNAMEDTCALQTKYTPDNGFIYGFEKPTLPEELDGMFNAGYADVTYNPTCGYMGTGSKVNLAYDGRNASYTAVVFGDVNGDAWYDGQDAAIVRCIVNGLMDESTVGEAAYKAADCNHDGVIDNLDTAILEDAGILLSKVDQSKSAEELMSTSSEFVEYINLIDQNPDITEKDDSDVVTETEFSLVTILVKSVLTFIGTAIALFKIIF